MANNGFSAVKNYWGSIDGLTPKSSSDGAASSVAEAPNSYGDTIAHDVYGATLSPSVEYAVTGEVDLSDIVLGSIHSFGSGGSAKSFMLTNVVVSTAANQPPTVTISGVQVEAGATAKRTYALAGTLTPRSRAQDVASAFGAPSTGSDFTSIATTFSVDPHVQSVAGAPVASDASHGKVEAQGVLTDPTGAAAISAGSGFTLTSVAQESAPDADYVQLSATSSKFLVGTEASS